MTQTIGDTLEPKMTHHSWVNLRDGSTPTTPPQGAFTSGEKMSGLTRAVPTDHLLESMLSSRFGGAAVRRLNLPDEHSRVVNQSDRN